MLQSGKRVQPPRDGSYRCHTEPSEMKNLSKLGKKVKRNVSPTDISLTTVSNLKMWLQSFSELLFSLWQSSKNLVSFDFSPRHENDTFGAKALKHGLLGEGGGILLSSPQTVAGAKNVHTKREVW